MIEELAALKLIIGLTIDGNRLYDLTDGGKKISGKKAIHQGRGGLEHRYYLEKIKAHYIENEGFTFIEKDNIDLVVETIEKKLAVQVETGKSNIQANLTRLGTYPADIKCMVATTQETKIKIKEMLENYLIPDRESISVYFVKDFLSHPPIL